MGDLKSLSRMTTAFVDFNGVVPEKVRSIELNYSKLNSKVASVLV